MAVRVWIGAIAIVGAAAIVLATRRSDATVEHPLACDPYFDFPVGPPDATGYYDAQPFGDNAHLGNDWNGKGGGNTDLGDPVYAVAEGIVIETVDHGGGWGNVIRIVHPCGTRGVESLYAHLETVDVAPGARVTRGQRIGTIGTAGGVYPAHLHLELRERYLPLGGGYAADTRGYLDPTRYIRSHRPR